MKRKLLSLLVLLMTAATGAWAQGYYINVDFDHYYNPMETNFHCMIDNMMDPSAEIKGTLELFVDDVSKGIFNVDGTMVDGSIAAIDAGNHTWSAVFSPDGGGSYNANGNFTINKADTYITYYGSTSINLGVGESTELDVYLTPHEAGELSYSSSDASVASITKKEYYYNTYIIQAKAAGTATITFSFAGSTNYEAADNKTITVTVAWPAIDVTANAGDAAGEYWATYYNSVLGYTADANTTVYQAKVNGTTTGVVLTEVASKEIPAGQGVVLKSSSSTITLTPATTTVTYSDNQLKGTDAALTTPANAYCLSKETSGSSPRGVGFYTYTLATIPAHKAYLVVAGGPSTSRGFLGFDEDDNTTGIGLPEAVVIEGDGPVFDLSGRRVMGQPQKGIYVKNGKKFVIK